MSNGKKHFIAPSVLAADPGAYRAEIEDVSKAGADWLHIDVMDGSYVPPITFGDNIVSVAEGCSDLKRDVHLMIVDPEKHIQTFKDAGTDLLTVHFEACTHPHKTLQDIRNTGMESGLALNPGTPAQDSFELLELADLVLVMTVNPGWGGQKFITNCLKKIESVKEEILRLGLPTLIEVDGGINAETGRQCLDAGADVLVAGTYIFNSKDRAAQINTLKEC